MSGHRRVLQWFCSLLLTVAVIHADQPAIKRVLFIGNSYTGVNDLPKIVGEIIRSSRNQVPVIRSSNPGGRTLENHCSIPETLALIDEGSWDVVILQGHSMEASQSEVSPAMRRSFLDSGKKLCELIRHSSPKARILLYQTWARHADFWKTPQPAHGMGDGPKQMLERNRKWYQQLADDNRAEVVRVGEAWQLYYLNNPKLTLHDPDHSHPNFQGSYLAGLLFYAAIYQTNQLHLTYRGNLTKEQTVILVDTATKILTAGK